MPVKTSGYAVKETGGKVEHIGFEQRDIGDADVHITIDYAGICHSDVLIAQGAWGPVDHPCVPGHEIIGTVKAVGKGVTAYKAGDTVAVGCFVDSCRKCNNCNTGEENYCLGEHGPIMTYNANMKYTTGDKTFGGYAKDIVCQERFVFKVPEKLKGKPEAAPLLCAGITLWHPMKDHCMDKPGKKIGIIGLGGLGHMALKFGVAFGNEVTIFSRSDKKKEMATKLGATRFVNTTDADQMAAVANQMDFMISTIPAACDLNQYLNVMAYKGVMVVVGVAPAVQPSSLHPFPLVFKRLTVTGALVGGVKQTQEMLEFCAEKDILPMCEIIPMKDVNEAWARMDKSDVQFRFVMEVQKTCEDAQ